MLVLWSRTRQRKIRTNTAELDTSSVPIRHVVWQVQYCPSPVGTAQPSLHPSHAVLLQDDVASRAVGAMLVTDQSTASYCSGTPAGLREAVSRRPCIRLQAPAPHHGSARAIHEYRSPGPAGACSPASVTACVTRSESEVRGGCAPRDPDRRVRRFGNLAAGAPTPKTSGGIAASLGVSLASKRSVL